MKNKLILLFTGLTFFSCQKEMPSIKEPCVALEAITDTITKVLVYEKKDWPEGYGMATKVNSLTWFKSVGFIYKNNIYLDLFISIVKPSPEVSVSHHLRNAPASSIEESPTFPAP